MKFTCELSDNFMEYQEIGDCVKLCDSYVDPNMPKMFCVLLRQSIEYYKEKEFKRLVQIVPDEEWKSILSVNPKWTYIRGAYIQETNCAIISCDINDAIECVAKAYGM